MLLEAVELTLVYIRFEGDDDIMTFVASSNLFSSMRLQINRSSSFGNVSI